MTLVVLVAILCGGSMVSEETELHLVNEGEASWQSLVLPFFLQALLYSFPHLFLSSSKR